MKLNYRVFDLGLPARFIDELPREGFATYGKVRVLTKLALEPK